MLKRTLKLGLSLCLAAGMTLAQQDPPEPASKPARKWETKPPIKKPLPAPPARVHAVGRDERKTSERVIAAEPNVAVKLCIAEGSVRINGSERNEVRVFVRNGRKFEFRSLEKNPE